mmetsp:Transcript_24905/g.40357  ORF Transcript_24905/g.40357 Transcript_24905/m.40357 type:complete len:244 (-) Transcript_24905:868-1599(-)
MSVCSDSSDDGGIGFFNPDLFTSNVDLERDDFDFGDGAVRVKLEYIHASNQLVETFVSRVIWPSAEAMCEYFASRPELVKGKRVLELGSGTGLCGITLALLGAEQVVMTDYNDKAVKLLQGNIDLNGVAGTCSCYTLTWGCEQQADQVIAKASAERANGGKFDMVIGTDVVYEPECIQPLLTSGKHMMNGNSAVFYLANHTHRYAGMEQQVKSTATELGLVEECLPCIRGEDGQIDVSIFRLN